MKRLPGAREAILAIFVALLCLIATNRQDMAGLRRLETAALDLHFRLRGARPPGPEVGVVLIDDKSLAAFGRWPFSRHLIAQAIRRLDHARARLVVLDLLLAEPAGMPAASQNLPDDQDTDLAAAIRTSGHVLLPIAFGFTGAANSPSETVVASAYSRFDNSPQMPAFPVTPVSILPPVPVLTQAALGLGHVNIAYDLDGAPRYDYLALPLGGDFFPSMAVRAAAAYRGVKWTAVGVALGQGVSIGDLSVPTDRGMRLLINYPGPRGTVPTWSFADLVHGNVPPSALAGRIIVLGASFTGNSDAYAGPFGNTPVTGTERLAAAIDTILGQGFILENPWPILVWVAVMAFAGLGGAAVARLPTRLSGLTIILPILSWAAVTQVAFLHGLWLPLVNPLIALGMALLATLMFRYWVSDRDARFIKLAFRHYLAPELVDALAANPAALRLGGETRTMTMMFCDIRGFTGMSEQLKDSPQLLTRLINRFLTPMTATIMAHRGTVDKYIGDCIMAFWNAPLSDPQHAVHACEAALAMLAALENLNDQLAADPAMAGQIFHALKVGIGLNSGDCTVGNMGSDQRFGYSVLGDAVNLAARLEGQSKLYGVSIIAGETTRALAPSFAFLEVDSVVVVGRTQPVRIYALLGGPQDAGNAAFQAVAKAHDEMLARYRAQDWAGARAALARGHALDSRLGTLCELYDKRISWYETHPPGDHWDGVFIAAAK